MKKIIAVVCLILAASWAVYLYGFVRTADAQSVSASYRSDPQLEPWVQHLQDISASMRRQMDLVERETKQKSATPAAEPSSNPIRNPFVTP